jgi:hypothetical protein
MLLPCFVFSLHNGIYLELSNCPPLPKIAREGEKINIFLINILIKLTMGQHLPGNVHIISPYYGKKVSVVFHVNRRRQ